MAETLGALFRYLSPFSRIFLVTELESEAKRVSDLAELMSFAAEADRRGDYEAAMKAFDKVEQMTKNTSVRPVKDLLLPDSIVYERLRIVTKYSLILLIPIALAYLLGIAVVWVVNGFKKTGG